MSLPQTQISLRSQAPLFAAMLAAAVTMFAPPVLNDGDTWWHLAAGQWILAHQQVPHVDPFSYTMRGHPWQAHEWLSEVELEWRITVKSTGSTGVEMEALTAASVAALTVYDMCKAIDRSMTISNLMLLTKTGGTRGDYQRNE